MSLFSIFRYGLARLRLVRSACCVMAALALGTGIAQAQPYPEDVRAKIIAEHKTFSEAVKAANLKPE